MTDANGYPTAETLAAVRSWDPTDFDGLAKFLCDAWHWPDRAKLDNGVLTLSTGGWSGNEELIGAIPAAWTVFHFEVHERGGLWVYAQRGRGRELPTRAQLIDALASAYNHLGSCDCGPYDRDKEIRAMLVAAGLSPRALE